VYSGVGEGVGVVLTGGRPTRLTLGAGLWALAGGGGGRHAASVWCIGSGQQYH
jgi:hypothetical protein